MENIIEVLKKAIGENNVIENEPMSKHTTFRIGGNADIFVTPQSTEDIENVIKIAEKTNTPYYIIGNGSNLLVKDNGIRGIVIQIYKKYSDITVNGNDYKWDPDEQEYVNVNDPDEYLSMDQLESETIFVDGKEYHYDNGEWVSDDGEEFAPGNFEDYLQGEDDLDPIL